MEIEKLTGWQPIETLAMWDVAIVTDGENVAKAQKAEADYGGHYFAVDPEDCLEWEPTLWIACPGDEATTRAPADLRSALEAETPALSDGDLDQHLPESVRAAKRCGIQRSDWLTGWYVPWSPRNDNQNAEGPWSDWVALAHAILAKDAEARAALAPTKGDQS